MLTYADACQGTCHAREEGWWHYELCHGANITQYRPKSSEKCDPARPETCVSAGRTQVCVCVCVCVCVSVCVCVCV
jgi:hypothetical protein